MKDLYRMSKTDALVLLVILIITVLLFVPWSRATRVGNIVVFGWGMGLLMFVGPLLGLAALAAGDQGDSPSGCSARTGGAKR